MPLREPSRRRRILFIDDEEFLLDGLEASLRDQRHRWEMLFARGGRAGLRLLEAGGVDTVVMDVMMPGMDGFAVLERIRALEHGRDVPVVMLTGISDTAIKRKALAAGADDLLSKPISREDLIARIESMLRIKSYQDLLRSKNEELDRKVQQRTRQLERSQMDIIWRLAKAAEFRDDDTGHHVMRVAHFSGVLAEAVGVEAGLAERIFLTSPLHDVGKIGIPDDILLKPSSLSTLEMDIMRRHCAIGAEILEPALPRVAGHPTPTPKNLGDSTGSLRVANPLLVTAATIALSHHERWEGRGYPRGLIGADIPIEGRIVAVADVFDALTSRRPYKAAMPEDEAVAIIADGRGAHFDPQVVDAFLACLPALRAVRTRFADDSRAATDGPVGPGRWS